MSKQDKVGWILVGNESYGSARIQGFNIHRYLCAVGVNSKILLAPDNADYRLHLTRLRKIIILAQRYSTVVFQKVFDESAVAFARILQRCGTRVVFVLCDQYRTPMLEVADRIIVSSSELSRWIDHEYGLKSVFIDDALEVSENDMAVARRVRAETAIDGPKIPVLWFGSRDNWESSQPVFQLFRDDEHIAHSFQLTTISDHPEADKLWSFRNVIEELGRTTIAVIPTDTTGWAMSKSSNRMSLCLAMGVPVIASPIPSYMQLASQTGGVLWASHPDEWRQQLIRLSMRSARDSSINGVPEKVFKLLSIAKIGPLWRTTLTQWP